MAEVSIRRKLVSKMKVTGIHLMISFVIFLVVLYLILVFWYPEPFFTAEGGWKGIRLMFLVDMVLGPSLTFIIYNILKSRREKILDFSVIGVIQLSALIWGGSFVYSQRPEAVVYWKDAFYTVTADYFEQQNVKNEMLIALSKSSPAWLFVKEPRGLEAQKEVIALIDQKIPPFAQYQLLKPLSSYIELVKQNSLSSEQIKRCDETIYDKLKNQEYQQLYLLIAKYKRFILLMDRQLKLISLLEIPAGSKCISR